MTAPVVVDPFEAPRKEARMHARYFVDAPGILVNMGVCSKHLQDLYAKDDKAGNLNSLGYWQRKQAELDASWNAVRRIADGKAIRSFDEYHNASRLADLLSQSHMKEGAHPAAKAAQIVINEFRLHAEKKNSVFDKIDAAKEVLAVEEVRKALTDFGQKYSSRLRMIINMGKMDKAIEWDDYEKFQRLLVVPLEDLKRYPDSTIFIDPTKVGGIRPILVMERMLDDLHYELQMTGSDQARDALAVLKAFEQDVKPHVEHLRSCANYAQGQAVAVGA